MAAASAAVGVAAALSDILSDFFRGLLMIMRVSVRFLVAPESKVS